MPSSSLFLRSSTTLISAFSFFLSLVSADGSTYQNVKSYNPQNFFDGFDFNTAYDPSHGFVQYLDRTSAKHMNIIRSDADSVYLSVDSTSILDPIRGPGRASVRIESKDIWTKGLFIADIPHMPDSVCGTWPAFWTLGQDLPWPNYGEIDILEGVSNHQFNLASLHGNDRFTITGDPETMTGELQTTDCDYHGDTSNLNPTGCGSIDNANGASFGDNFNAVGGNIMAMEWTDNAIKVWRFPRGTEPSDIHSDNPDPDHWGLPAQAFSGPDINLQNFRNHKIIFNTNFCGDWAGATWEADGCKAATGYNTCADYVANSPSDFVNSYWAINSLKIYQKLADPTSTTSTSSSTTSSSTTSSSSSSSTTSSTTTSSSSSSSSDRTTSTAASTTTAIFSTTSSTISPDTSSSTSLRTVSSSATPIGSSKTASTESMTSNMSTSTKATSFSSSTRSAFTTSTSITNPSFTTITTTTHSRPLSPNPPYPLNETSFSSTTIFRASIANTWHAWSDSTSSTKKTATSASTATHTGTWSNWDGPNTTSKPLTSTTVPVTTTHVTETASASSTTAGTGTSTDVSTDSTSWAVWSTAASASSSFSAKKSDATTAAASTASANWGAWNDNSSGVSNSVTSPIQVYKGSASKIGGSLGALFGMVIVTVLTL